MRTMTANQSSLLASNQRSTYAKVEIDATGAGGWVDLGAVTVTTGVVLDFVTSVAITDNIDQPSMTASVTLDRNIYNYSLSPLMTGSKLNSAGTLIGINKRVRISIATVAYGTTPVSTDYTLVFFGRSYSMNWSSYDFVLECHDMVGELMSSWIEPPVVQYGSNTGVVLAETVMQAILTKQTTLSPLIYLGTLYSITGTGGTPFQVADSPAWALREFQQEGNATYTGLNVIAQQIGWLLRQKYNTSVGAYVLTWYDPARSGTTSLRTFPGTFYEDVTEISLHLGDIRNVIRVCWEDTKGNKQSSVYSDGTSITSYGRQFMQLAQEATVNLHTVTEADKMGNGALSDLAQPMIQQGVTMPMFWPVEVGDIYTFSANGYHFDTDQKLSVIQYTHTWNQKSAETTMMLRGKPSGGVATWIDKQSFLIKRKFGTVNQNTYTDPTNQHPNGYFNQFSRF